MKNENSEQPAPAQNEFDIRGILAGELKCWHRLTKEEADNLVAFVKSSAPQPPQRKPLTDEQIKAVIAKIDPNEHYLPNALRQLARSIEAAHGITGEKK